MIVVFSEKTVNIWTLIPLISCLSYIALCAVAIQSIEKNSANRNANKLFVLYLAVAASWSFAAFMLRLNAFPPQALRWNEILTIALVGTLITYYHFTRVYTNRMGGTLLYIGYTMLALLAVLSLTGKIVQYSYVSDGTLYHSLGNSIYFIGILSFIYTIAVILLLIKRYRTTTNPADRNRTVYLIVGWTILVTLTYTNLIPALAGLPLDHIGNLFNAIIIAYTISRFHLLDIKFVVRRGLTYSVLITALVALYMGAIFLGYNAMPTQPAISIVTLATVVALLLTLTASPMEHFIREGVDRLFYRETYKYRRTLLNFRNKMGNILNLEELANEILPAITKALYITQSRLLFQDTGSGDFVTQFIYPPRLDADVKGDLKLNVDNPIVSWLDKQNTPLSVDQLSGIPELKGLWQSEKEQIARAEVGLLCPVTNGKLIGILALGKKIKDTSYTHEDIELVRSMASQAGVIVENAQLFTRATQLANTDWLTGLYNHRNFHEHMEQEIARSSRFGTVFSLIMMDIDLFKSYNDTCGHLAGDEALRTISKTIQNSIRGADLAFRYGGEEFSVVLPETRLEEGFRAAERIRQAVETKTKTLVIPITMSLGIASWPLDGVMKEEIIARADAALYRAKETGRNKTCLSTEVTRTETPLIGVELENRSRAISIVYALAATVDAKDHYTYGHSKKVSDYAVALGEAMDLPPNRIATIRAAGLLHDIGKVGISDSILKKNAPLTPADWELIKAHPRVGVEILRHVSDLSACLPAILHHHERYDGTGYPSGLKGDAIPLEARILAVVDAYEAITSQRSYRSQPTPQEALSELRASAGIQFDPELVNIFCKVMEPAAARAARAAEVKP